MFIKKKKRERDLKVLRNILRKEGSEKLLVERHTEYKSETVTIIRNGVV